MFKLNLILITLSLSIGAALAQNRYTSSDITYIPTQKELAMRGIPYFFRDVPEYVENKILTSMGMDDFNFFVNLHYQNQLKSPFNVFLGNQNRRSPTQESYFPFTNTKSDFSDLMIDTYGVCSGVSYLLRKFNMLAYFDPENRSREQIPSENDAKWFAFYKKKIDAVMNLQPVIIPGFKNLNEFASSKMNSYIRKTVIQQWVINNVSISGLIQMSGMKKKFSTEKSKSLYLELAKRLALKYNPIVYLAKPSDFKESSSYWIHVLQVTRLTAMREDGSYEVFVLDINNSEAALAETAVTMRVENGVTIPIWTQDFKELSAIHLVPNDDREITQMVKNKLSWCALNVDTRSLCQTGSFFSELSFY